MAMDHWYNARNQLFKSLEEACDRVGHELANVIPRETDIVLHRDEVEVLRERSTKVYKLMEENQHLVSELKEFRDAARREKSLNQETDARTIEQKQASRHDITIAGASPRLAPPRGPPKTPGPPAASGASYDVMYYALSEKYNKLTQSYKELGTAHKALTDTLKKAMSKNGKWIKYSDCRDKLLLKKEGVITRLEGEVQTLRSLMDEHQRCPSSCPSGSPTLEVLVDALEKEKSRSLDLWMRLESCAKEIESKEQKMANMKDQLRDFQSLIRDHVKDRQLGHENLAAHQADSDESRGQGRYIHDLVDYIQAGPFHDGSKVLGRDDFVKYLSNYDLADLPNENLPNTSGVGIFIGAEQVTASSNSGVKPEPPSQDNTAGTSDPQLPPLRDSGMIASLPSENSATKAVEHHSSTTQDTVSPPAIPGYMLDIPAEGRVFAEPPSSPDIPVVIFSRSVTKRRRRDTPSEATSAPRIKIESISSSPIGISALRVEESVDLDDIGGKVDTPRKHRPMRARSGQIVRSQASATDASQNSNIGTSSLARHTSTMDPDTPSAIPTVGSVLTSLNSNKRILRWVPPALSAKPKSVSDKSVADVSEDGEITLPLQFSKDSYLNTSGKIQRLDDLLAKPSPPKQVLLTAPAARATLIKGDASRALSLASLAEKMVSISPNHGMGLGRQTPRFAAAPLEGVNQQGPTPRLGVSSLHPAPEFKYQARPSPASVGPASSVQTSLPEADRTILDSSEYTPTSFRTQLIKPAFSRIAANGATPSTRKRQYLQAKEQVFRSDVAPEHEPLRNRSLQTLSIEDFKINPQYNHGYKFAFSDVVRKQADRSCLPGCTKPECCGNKFRALAEVQRHRDDLLTLSQEEADARLLEEFLGDNAYKLRTMSKEERDEILLQARTRELAKKHGKHRHAFERRKSPPGFWRTDFPTTQEESTDKEKAKDFERQLIAQRYEEAMRPKGAFMFRDE